MLAVSYLCENLLGMMYDLAPNPNLNPSLTPTIKPRLNRQTGLCEDQQEDAHFHTH